MIIRTATREDIPRIVEMAERFYPESGYGEAFGPMQRESIAGLAIITMERGVLLLAEHEGEVVGMICLHLDHFLFNVDVRVAVELVFWIEPEHRGGMAAVRLLKAGEAAAREAGAHVMRMAVLATSPAQASGLYERTGYAASDRFFTKALTE